MKKLMHKAARSRTRGMSLIELMVSLVIGLVVVGAVIVSYLGSGQANRLQTAYAEMNENAQIAMSMMQQDLMLAGYAQAKGTNTVAGVTTFDKTFSGKPVFGCDSGFTAPNQLVTMDSTGCAASGSPAIEMSYEADVTNSVPNGIYPSDCLGNSLRHVEQTVAVGANNITFYETHNRYFLSTGSTGRSELHCASAAKTAGGAAIPSQPLVDNVEAMKIWYGEAGAAGSRQIVRYVTATAGNTIDWQNIISVRVCLLMRSAETVLNAEDTSAGTASYLDCDSASQTSADGYLRRTYFMTTTLRNKMSL